jgi:hypothetical protein
MVDELSMRAHAPGVAVPDVDGLALLERERTGEPPLSSAEREALERARAEHLADYEAFARERFPTWRAWMLAVACE